MPKCKNLRSIKMFKLMKFHTYAVKHFCLPSTIYYIVLKRKINLG